MPVYRFHFSLGQMLFLTAAVGAWFAALGVLPGPWMVWLATVVVYLTIVLCFSAPDDSSGEAEKSPGKAGG
ncbi:MAG: hypothetical protein WD063_15860 [Pirellulales bacterium]